MPVEVTGISDVFPAYAGVSLSCASTEAQNACLPRLRGGEPCPTTLNNYIGSSSPPTRG